MSACTRLGFIVALEIEVNFEAANCLHTQLQMDKNTISTLSGNLEATMCFLRGGDIYGFGVDQM